LNRVEPTEKEEVAKRSYNAFDLFVFAGAAVNVVVVLALFGYWVTH